MDVLDEFSRTFLPLAGQAGVPMAVLARHMPIFRRYVPPTDTALLVARCVRPEKTAAGTHFFLLTREHLVVTCETRLRRRPQPHLWARVGELEGVTWQTDPTGAAVEVALTSAEGRQRFFIRGAYPRQLWRFDAALDKAFRASADVARRRSLFAPRSAARIA